MKRRQFLNLIGGGVLTSSFAARAQTEIPTIGYLSGRSVDSETPLREPILKSLEESGFVDGRNMAIQYRYSQGREDLLPELASDLVQRHVTLIVATSNTAASAAKSATSTIPIIFSVGDDPVRQGLVASLSRPSSNATGVHVFTSRLGAKRLSLLRTLLPNPDLVAFIVDPRNITTATQIEEMQEATRAIGQPLALFHAASEAEVDAAFSTMAQQKVAAVQYGAALFFQVIQGRLIDLAERYRIPASYEWREAVIAGGLMSYNVNRTASSRQIGLYVAKILNGAKPADLPVVQSSSFLLSINLKTAKALGLDMPAALLAQADEVVE